HDYTKIILDHRDLPPSLIRNAGELQLEKETNRMLALAERAGRKELNAEELAKLEELKQRIATETMEINGKTVKVHERRYYMGTDYHGRDMLARIIYGGQMSIAIGFVGTLTSVLIGIVIGALAGYTGGKVDYIIMRVVDVIYGLPYMLLVIIFMAMLGKTDVHFRILSLFLALSVVSWLTVARVVRGQIISLKNSEFVEAARSVGAGPGRIIFRHLLPNTLGVIIVFSTLRVPSFIMMEAFLSFLGLGVSAPFASWGLLVGEAVEGMAHYPWRLFFPALAMTVFLFSMNFLGDGLRDAFDPQSKNRL
ncbi:MAG TPA: ABC transporter permease, partial [Spirochaetia bacterium]|nr:ABC transporter permease [Spirochaetia bacterium]